MSRYEERREERRKYEADVYYEVWRSGGNPDRVDRDRVDDHFYNGDYCESAARHELQLQRKRQEDESEERMESMMLHGTEG